MSTVKTSLENKTVANSEISDRYKILEKYEERQNIAVKTGVFFNHEREVEEVLGTQ